MIATAWPEYYGASGLGDPDADMSDRCRRHSLPYGVVAQSKAGKVVGTAALSGQSYGATDAESVWVVGLFVLTEARGKGVGSALIEALEEYARMQGYADLHCTTVEAAGLLRRLGWHNIRRFQDDDACWRVLQKTL